MKNNIDFIVNVGCGLEFRNRRLNLNKIKWFNIDLKEVIDFRNEKNIEKDITKFDFLIKIFIIETTL